MPKTRRCDCNVFSVGRYPVLVARGDRDVGDATRSFRRGDSHTLRSSRQEDHAVVAPHNPDHCFTFCCLFFFSNPRPPKRKT